MAEPQTSQIARFPRTFTLLSPDSASHQTKCKVEYSEYQAFGEPLHNLGTIGDIYVDLTKGSHTLYAKVEDGWKRWPGPSQRNSSPRHPTYGTYMLWCRVEKNSLGWIPKKSVTRILMSSASQAISAVLSGRLTAHRKQLKKNANDVALSFSVPPAVNARPIFITRSSIPEHSYPYTESKTETLTQITAQRAIKRNAGTKSNQIVGTELANSKDLEEMRAYVMMTLMNAANGTHIVTPSVSPKRDSNRPELEAGPSFEQPANLLFTPLPSPKREPALEAGPSSQRPAHLLFTPSLSPKLDFNKPELEAATSSQRPAHLLFTPSLSPELDSNKLEIDAGTSSQRPAHLLFTPSPLPKPAPKLPGPDLAHIFTPTASPPPVPTPETEQESTHSLTPTVTSLTQPTSATASSSTLSSTSFASKPDPRVSSRSGVKRLSIKRPAPLSRSCSPTDLPKTPKTPKTLKTPEKRTLTSSSSSWSVSRGKTKVPSVKKPMVSLPEYTPCVPMDLDDDHHRGGSELGDEATNSRVFLGPGGDRDNFVDGDGDERMDMDVRRTASDRLPRASSSSYASPSKPASEHLAARKRTGAIPTPKRLAARKRTSAPMSPTKKSDERLARKEPVRVKKELGAEKVDVKTEEQQDGDDSDIVVLSVVKRCVPAVTLSPTKLKMKVKKWPAQNPEPEHTSSPSSGSGSSSSSSLSSGKLKTMPYMKNRRPSEQIRRTATIDRKPSIANIDQEVIDLTMDSDEQEDEEARERRNVRPLLLLRATKSCYGGGEGAVEREGVKEDEEVGMGVGGGGDEVVEDACDRDEVENDAPDDLREEVDHKEGLEAETVLAPADGPSCETGDAEDDKMVEDPSLPVEEPGPERETTAPVDSPSAGCVAGQVGRPEEEEDAMAEDPSFPVEEPASEREEPTLAPEPVHEDLPAIAAVDESAHQTESDTETLDGYDGDATMGDDTMVWGLDDDDEQEVDELADEEAIDLDWAAEAHWQELHLNLLFGSEGMGGCERYCRFCLGQSKGTYSVQVQDTPHERWSLIRQKVIKHCTLNHARECQALLGMSMDELTDMETQLANVGTASMED